MVVQSLEADGALQGLWSVFLQLFPVPKTRFYFTPCPAKIKHQINRKEGMGQQFSIVYLGIRVRGTAEQVMPALGKEEGTIRDSETTIVPRESSCAPLTSAWKEIPPFWRQQELFSDQEGSAISLLLVL